MLADEFTGIFRDEHRQVRDGLLDLQAAFHARDRERVAELLGRIAALTGPHFRYEEESLYPDLVGIFDPAYVDSLLDDHDGVVAGARRLVELAGGALDDADVAEAVAVVRGILPHVSDCDGLSIMVERLDDATVRGILDARDRSLEAGVDLLRWADEIRRRPVLSGSS